MGMYIIGKEPDRCGACPCFHAESPMYCQAVKAAVQKPRIVHPYAKGRPEWCPLIEIPPHGDLIDANKLAELCDIMADKCDGIGVSIWHQFKTTVEWSPIVIPAEPPKEENNGV